MKYLLFLSFWELLPSGLQEMHVHLKGERAERGEGCSQGMGNLMLLFYQGWWSIWGNLLCDFTTKHLKRGDQSSSWGNGTCWAAYRAQNQAWGWALAVAALSVDPQRCAGGSRWRSPSCLFTGSLASADQTNMLLCQLKIFPRFPKLYNQLCFDMYQCENNAGAKAVGVPESQQPNSASQERE